MSLWTPKPWRAIQSGGLFGRFAQRATLPGVLREASDCRLLASELWLEPTHHPTETCLSPFQRPQPVN